MTFPSSKAGGGSRKGVASDLGVAGLPPPSVYTEDLETLVGTFSSQ